MYIDIFILVNLIMDRLSLECALRKYNLSQWRLGLGAMVGTLGALVWETTGISVLLRPVGAFLLAVCMVYICIGRRPGGQWRRALMEMYGYGFVFAGVIPYISRYIPVWIGSVLISYSGIRIWLWWKEKKQASVVQVWFEMNQSLKKLSGVIDTGHRLVEPITGKPVVIIRKDCVPENVEAGWPICFETVQGKGVMFGFWPEKLWIDGQLYKKKEIMVAVAEEWKEKNWDALVPGYVME